MEFKINGKDVKLKFGVKFCRELDKSYEVEYEGIKFGMGVNLAAMGIDQYNPVAAAEVIKAATSHVGFTADEIDDAIDEYAENENGLGKLFNQLKDELGKSQVVADTIKHFQKTAKAQ